MLNAARPDEGLDEQPPKGSRSGPAGAPGQSPSAEYAAYLRRRRVYRRAVLAGQLLLLAGVLLLWEVGAKRHWVNPLLTSYPSAVWATFRDLVKNGVILHHTGVTLGETVIGFCAGMAMGILVAAVIWWFPYLSRVVDPYLVVANALPKIALAPIFYIWLGDVLSIYGMAVAISVIVSITMVYTGFQEVDPNKIKVLQTFGATRWQILRKVILPGSVPTMIAALKVNVGLTLVGVIVGEFQAAKAGLGYLIIYSSQVFQMNVVMTAVVILGVISAVMYVFVHYLESAILRWRSR